MQKISCVVLCVVASCHAALQAADESSNGPVTTRIYSVTDLVMDVQASQAAELQRVYMAQGEKVPDALVSAGKDQKAAIEEDMEELIELIQSTTVPGEWESMGGVGRIASHCKSRSLIVRLHETGHQEVSDLLLQLRRANDLQVQLTFEYLCDTGAKKEARQPAVAHAHVAQPSSAVTPAQATLSLSSSSKTLKQMIDGKEKAGQLSMTADQLVEFREQIKDVSVSQLTHTALIRNGYSGLIGICTATPVVTSDRRHVSISHSIPGSSLAGLGHVRVADGETRVVRLNIEDEVSYMLVTARIRVFNEEDEP